MRTSQKQADVTNVPRRSCTCSQMSDTDWYNELSPSGFAVVGSNREQSVGWCQCGNVLNVPVVLISYGLTAETAL